MTEFRPQILQFNFSTAAISSADDCFQVGECTKSFQLHVERAGDEFECLNICKSYPDCNWMTFDSHLADCRLFHNCTSLDAPRCPSCLSGQIGDCSVCLLGIKLWLVKISPQFVIQNARLVNVIKGDPPLFFS